MTEPKTYTGSCHCGAVRYEVTMELGTVLACNCSMCSRAGTWLAFVPADKFKLLSGEDSLSGYKFNKHKIEHMFCKVCGIKPFAKGVDKAGNDIRAINTRCLEDVDLTKLDVQNVDGKSF